MGEAYTSRIVEGVGQLAAMFPPTVAITCVGAPAVVVGVVGGGGVPALVVGVVCCVGGRLVVGTDGGAATSTVVSGGRGTEVETVTAAPRVALAVAPEFGATSVVDEIDTGAAAKSTSRGDTTVAF